MRKHATLVFVVLLLVSLLPANASVSVPSSELDAVSRPPAVDWDRHSMAESLPADTVVQPRMEEAFRSSPVMFIENVGQFAEGARFQVRGGPGMMRLAEVSGQRMMSPGGVNPSIDFVTGMPSTSRESMSDGSISQYLTFAQLTLGSLRETEPV